jgi:GPI mannosyltransferase 3
MTAGDPPRRVVFAWIAIAFVVRAWQIAVEPAYLHPDALLQGLEPAFRALHGHGIATWEFREGLRSWVWPGLLAIPMGATEALGIATIGTEPGMAPAIASARALVAAIDVVTVVLAARIVSRIAGSPAAWGVALVLAVHPAFAVMGIQPLVDVPAAAALAWACERALVGPVQSRRSAIALGVALATTAMLRVQLWPAVAAVVIGLVVATRRARLRWDPLAGRDAIAAALAVVIVFAVVDMATWGVPLRPVVAYIGFQLDGGATSFGTMPVDRYWRDLGLALPWIGIAALVLAMVGTRRVPLLGVVVVAVVVPHQLLDYRVWRFVHPALPLLVALAAIGAHDLVAALDGRLRARGLSGARAVALVLAGGVAIATVDAWRQGSPWATTWLFDRGGWAAVERARGIDLALLELSARPAPRRIAQAVLPAAATPGHALLGHDVEVVPLLDTNAAPPDVDVWIMPTSIRAPPQLRELWVDREHGVVVLAR